MKLKKKIIKRQDRDRFFQHDPNNHNNERHSGSFSAQRLTNIVCFRLLNDYDSGLGAIRFFGGERVWAPTKKQKKNGSHVDTL